MSKSSQFCQHSFQDPSRGCCYIVATPIGHLDDITLRATQTLQSVDLIAAEDTRHTRILLRHLNIDKPLLALHRFNEAKAAQTLLAKLKDGQNIALVSDAGTPLISDPGATLVSTLRDEGIAVIPIPGVSALICALSASGLAETSFHFAGFLPAKAKSRRDCLQQLEALQSNLVFYEAPHRIQACLQDMVDILGKERYAIIARELTKRFETFCGDSLQGLLDWLASDSNQLKGEFVIVVAPSEVKASTTLSSEAKRCMAILSAELSGKQAAKLTAQLTGASKKALYQYGLQLKEG